MGVTEGEGVNVWKGGRYCRERGECGCGAYGIFAMAHQEVVLLLCYWGAEFGKEVVLHCIQF